MIPFDHISELLSLTDSDPLYGASPSRYRSIVRMYTSCNDLLCTLSSEDLPFRTRMSSRVRRLYVLLRRQLSSSCPSAPMHPSPRRSSPVAVTGPCVPSPSDACFIELMLRLSSDFTMSVSSGMHEESHSLLLRHLPRLISSCTPDDEPCLMSCVLYGLGSSLGDVRSLDAVQWYLGVCRRWLDELPPVPVPGTVSSSTSPSPFPSLWPGVSSSVTALRLSLLLDGVHVFGEHPLSSPSEHAVVSFLSGLRLPSSLGVIDLPPAVSCHELLCSPWADLSRLPLRKELSSLIDEFSRRSEPLTDEWYMSVSSSMSETCLSVLESYPSLRRETA